MAQPSRDQSFFQNRSKRSSSSTIPWEKFMDGRVWDIPEQQILNDYGCKSVQAFQNKAWTRATRKFGKKIHTDFDKATSTLRIQAYVPDEV